MFSPSFILYTLGSGGPEQEGIMLGLQAQNPISFQQSSFYVVLLLLCPDQANRGEECRRPLPCRKQGTKGRCPCFWASGTGFLVSFHIHLDWKIRASVGRIIPLHLFLSGGNNTSENVFLLAPTFPLFKLDVGREMGGLLIQFGAMFLSLQTQQIALPPVSTRPPGEWALALDLGKKATTQESQLVYFKCRHQW